MYIPKYDIVYFSLFKFLKSSSPTLNEYYDDFDMKFHGNDEPAEKTHKFVIHC